MPVADASVAAPVTVAAGSGRASEMAVAASKAGQYQRTHPPRPRKQGKRR
jgi:hypothetical protein